jgi:hypothetical protein
MREKMRSARDGTTPENENEKKMTRKRQKENCSSRNKGFVEVALKK